MCGNKKEFVNKVIIDVDFDRYRLESIFYIEHDVIAHAMKSNGTEILLKVCGDVRLEHNGELYRKNQITELLEDMELDDDSFLGLVKSEEIVVGEDNWFEIFYIKDGKLEPTECVVVDLIEGLSLIQQFISDDNY